MKLGQPSPAALGCLMGGGWGGYWREPGVENDNAGVISYCGLYVCVYMYYSAIGLGFLHVEQV